MASTHWPVPPVTGRRPPLFACVPDVLGEELDLPGEDLGGSVGSALRTGTSGLRAGIVVGPARHLAAHHKPYGARR